MFKLLIKDDEGNQKIVPVARDEVTIGRREGNTIRLLEKNISRRHARIFTKEGHFYLEDVASSYGVKLNGYRIYKSVTICSEDEIKVGDYRVSLLEVARETQDSKGDLTQPNANQPAEEVNLTDDDFRETTIMRGRSGSSVKKGIHRPVAGADIILHPARLVLLTSPEPGREFPIKGKEILIGRGDRSNIMVDHLALSRSHARIVANGSGFDIEDMESVNGTLLNGKPLPKAQGKGTKSILLESGDIIGIGPVQFRYVSQGEVYHFDPQEELQIPPSPAPSSPIKEGARGWALFIVAVLLVAGVTAGLVTHLMDDRPYWDDEATVAKTVPVHESYLAELPLSGEQPQAIAAEAEAVADGVGEIDEESRVGEVALEVEPRTDEAGNGELPVKHEHARADNIENQEIQEVKKARSGGVVAGDVSREAGSSPPRGKKGEDKESAEKRVVAKAPGPSTPRNHSTIPLDQAVASNKGHSDAPSGEPMQRTGAPSSAEDKPLQPPTPLPPSPVPPPPTGVAPPKRVPSPPLADPPPSPEAPPVVSPTGQQPSTEEPSPPPSPIAADSLHPKQEGKASTHQSPPASSGQAEFDIQSLQLKKEQAETHVKSGRNLFAQGKLGEAVEELNRAIRLDPSYPEPHLTLGLLYNRSGRTAEAISSLEKFIRLAPNDNRSPGIRKMIMRIRASDKQ